MRTDDRSRPSRERDQSLVFGIVAVLNWARHLLDLSTP